jgi:teichuronic acid biosynthesis glycosyltransferase TuaG
MYCSKDGTAPRVSVVMPVYNAARFLASALASVQAQSFTDWELIAVDDGSTDPSGRILADLAAQEPRLRPLSTGGNQGAGVARNLGLDAARGRFVAFLDADDLWHPEKLARQLIWFEAHPAALSFTAYQREDLETGRTEGVGVPERITARQLRATNVIGCSTVMLDRARVGEMRMPNLRLRQDFAFWLEILRQHGPAQGIPFALTTYRRHKGQVSGDKGQAARATWAMYRGHLGLSWPVAAWSFANYALRGVLRHRMPALARRLGWLQSPVLPPAPDQPVLTVAIATTSARLGQINFADLPAQSGVTYHIWVQGAQTVPLAARRDIRISPSPGRGAATNRNTALAAAQTPLLIFADDDLGFEPAGHAALIARFAARPKADFLCARLCDEAGALRKPYGPQGQRVRWWNCGKVGTPELALRPDRFRAKGIAFDPRFGAGMPNHLGDEYIFLCDALRAGLRGEHADIVLASHARHSSGTATGTPLMKLRKRALIRALGRWQSRPALLAFALRHRHQFPSWRDMLRFL